MTTHDDSTDQEQQDGEEGSPVEGHVTDLFDRTMELTRRGLTLVENGDLEGGTSLLECAVMASVVGDRWRLWESRPPHLMKAELEHRIDKRFADRRGDVP